MILGVLALLFTGYSLAQILSDAVNGLLPMGAISALTSLKLLISMDVILPISLFIAVVAGFGRLQADGEVTAMLALGMGPRELLAPVMGVALALGIFVTALSAFARPWAYTESHEITQRAVAMLNVNAMEAGTFYASSDGNRVIFLGERAGPHADAKKVFFARRNGDHIEVIYAGSASPATNSGDGQRIVRLSDAHIYEFYRDNPANDQSIEAQTLNVDPDGGSRAPYSWRYSSVAASIGHLLRSSLPPDIAERQWRFSTGLSTILLALLGALLCRGGPRESRYARFGPAILAYSAYYLVCSSARTWVQHGVVGAFPGLWWAPALLGLVILVLWYTPAIRRNFRLQPQVPSLVKGQAATMRLRPAGPRDAA